MQNVAVMWPFKLGGVDTVIRTLTVYHISKKIQQKTQAAGSCRVSGSLLGLEMTHEWGGAGGNYRQA